MGAWGYKIFEDDSAIDSFYELMESDPIEYIKDSFANVIDSDFIEYDDCQSALVSASLIDMILNGVDYDGAEEYDSWIKENKNLNVENMKNIAVQSLKLVLSDKSELNELWQENIEVYPVWKEYINDIIDRLQN